MLASEGGNHEGVHKKVLGPNVEVHEAHRQVIMTVITSAQSSI